jgi:stage II sporulation protein D
MTFKSGGEPELDRRQFLAAGGLLLLGCASAPRALRPAAEPPLPVSEPLVRVGLALARPETRFLVTGGRYLIHEERGDDPIAVAADGEPWGIAARGTSELRVIDPRGYLSRPHVRPVRVEPLDTGSTLRVDDGLYAGALEVRPGPGGATLVNELPLEEYLRGVVPHEMPAGEESLEALKAQVIAARTYALKRLGSRAELGFDLFADVQDQVYGGLGEAGTAADRALAETRGRVLLSGRHLIDAYYHSTCGGSTAAVEEAFPLPPVPYLVSVEDRDGRGGFFCAGSRYFRWQASFEREQLEALLARNLPRFVTLPRAGVGTLTDVAVAASSQGGRVLALRVETTTGNYQVARNDVRWIFAAGASPGLRSTLFLLRKERRRGFVDAITLTGGGWGHGVGMCQVGALGRAAAGAGHAEILAHYYTGTNLERLYG